MSNIIECSDNSPLKKILRDDEWKEINEEHSFHIDVDITISHYLNQLADFLCDDNNIINDHEMLHPSDDNSRHIEHRIRQNIVRWMCNYKPTPSSSPKDNSSSTSSEHVEEILSSFIEENVEELSDSENGWDTPENSDYELE
ncbi:4000_t:CDS:2 [Racocetra fulgida]|uniref:4000_t:CDS:1 n=1 Tax=Racocetra fulgida TaxID=60492 RepID=A0A9N8VL68_9GLOM|nr:4000_t:CDS:2 [Racocetra fulgida]